MVYRVWDYGEKLQSSGRTRTRSTWRVMVTARVVAKATSTERATATHLLGERAEVRIVTGISF